MIYTINEIQRVAISIIENAESKVVCFYGEMGAGKTTLIKALVKELSGADNASSPTFGIVNEYHVESGEVLGYHFDFYRLGDETEALDLGFEDYVNQDVWIFIEWPEKIPSFLPQDVTEVHLKIFDSETRELLLS
jgi:tRNA threonylcarbamoyladenosine biosynthesis protein TsaE